MSSILHGCAQTRPGNVIGQQIRETPNEAPRLVKVCASGICRSCNIGLISGPQELESFEGSQVLDRGPNTLDPIIMREAGLKDLKLCKPATSP